MRGTSEAMTAQLRNELADAKAATEVAFEEARRCGWPVLSAEGRPLHASASLCRRERGLPLDGVYGPNVVAAARAHRLLADRHAEGQVLDGPGADPIAQLGHRPPVRDSLQMRRTSGSRSCRPRLSPGHAISARPSGRPTSCRSGSGRCLGCTKSPIC